MKSLLKGFLVTTATLISVGTMTAQSVFTDYSFQPEENKTVAKISKIKIDFPNGDYRIEIDHSKENDIILSGNNTTYSCVSLSGYGSSWSMEFANNPGDKATTITKSGNYNLLIPAGLFKYDSSDDVNSEINATFIVSSELEYSWTSYPQTGTTHPIPEYGDIDISFTFTDATTCELTPSVEGASISVKLAGNPLTQFDSLDENEGFRLSAYSNTIRLQVSKSLITDSAELTFTADKGAFTIDGIKSPAIDYKVTYTQPKQYTIKLDPQDGSTVNNINEVYVMFPEATTVTKKSIFWDTDATLKSTDGKTISSIKTEEVQKDGLPAIKASFEGTIADGAYTFNIPDGYIMLDNVTSAPEVNATFNVDASFTPTTSNSLPYYNKFDSLADAEGFTIIDCNNDERTWEWVESEYPEGCLKQEMRVSEIDGKDDWLITPAFNLETGNVYRIAFDARPYGFWSEEFEVSAGTENTVEGMTTTILSKTHLRDGSKGEGRYFCYFTPQQTAEYYFGIHAMKETNGFYLYIDNLEISAPLDKSVPESVTDFKLVVDNHNSKKAFISFIAPDKDLAGNTLENLSKIEIYRDGSIIKTFDTPAPGSEISYTDFVDAPDDYIYQVKVYNNAGEGKGVIHTVFVGVKKASFPTNVHARETEKIGEVTITWDAPATDIDGDPINPNQITYYIVRVLDTGDQVEIARYVKGTSYTYQAIGENDEQEFFSFGVFAETDGGFSNGSQTRLIPLGRPYNIPFIESFNFNTISLIATSPLNGMASWGIYGEREGGVPAFDTDDSYAGMFGPQIDDSAILYTAKIDLRSASNPHLSFYVYNFAQNAGEQYSNILDVKVNSGEDFQTCKTIDLMTLGNTSGWIKQTIDLSDYKGKSPQIGFVATTKSTLYPNTFIDCIEVVDDLSGIVPIGNDKYEITVNDDNISINNPNMAQVIVASIDGIIIYNSYATNADICNLSRGIYVVRVGEKSVKVSIR